MILQKRGRYEKKKKKKKEIMAPSTLLQAFNIFGKLREMGRGERKRENGFFFYNYFAVVSSQDWLA